ncbi:ABC transporter ATP-binding protein [Candidatus Parcubacteria bacterium]|nr:ABC transporter ATP-binding protein [Candidatus Parcubacteria bacterium]
MNAIEVKDLRKTYTGTKGQGNVEALKGVTLTVSEGDFFALLGPNGAGKTTIIGILTSLVNKTSGEAHIFGADIEKDRSLAKTYIGLVPQEFNFNIFEKVIDIVTTQAGFYGMPRKEAIHRADELLKDLGLWDKRNVPSQALSGGMKRRLMIARGLVHAPKLLILDEPTAGVDVEMRHDMWTFLRKLNEQGTTIVLTTHYLEEAEALCRNIAIINKGSIVVNESMKQLLESRGHAKLEEIYLDLIKQEKPS